MQRVLVLVLVAAFCLAGCGDKPAATTPGDGPGTILMVVTSHDHIDADHETGLWLEEFAVPYKLFTDAGYTVTVASPKGGDTPIDPRSMKEGETPEPAVLKALQGTHELDDVDLDTPVAVFFPGGHGPMFDMPGSKAVQKTVAHFLQENRPTAFVCHGPVALVGATLSDGTSVVKGRKVTGFTNSEEAAVKLTEKMPFLLETKLKELGGTFTAADDWAVHVVVDGNLITGQNPASSTEAANAVLAQLGS
jgi:putative intracellular protease/amidase